MSASGDTVPKASAGRGRGEGKVSSGDGAWGAVWGTGGAARPRAAWREGLQGRGDLWPRPPPLLPPLAPPSTPSTCLPAQCKALPAPRGPGGPQLVLWGLKVPDCNSCACLALSSETLGQACAGPHVVPVLACGTVLGTSVHHLLAPGCSDLSGLPQQEIGVQGKAQLAPWGVGWGRSHLWPHSLGRRPPPRAW